MCCWQVEGRKRTRRLIELGGIYGALLWMAEKLRSPQAEHAREVWTAKGEQAFEVESEGKEFSDR
jgi:Conjugal transfer protein TraD